MMSDLGDVDSRREVATGRNLFWRGRLGLDGDRVLVLVIFLDVDVDEDGVVVMVVVDGGVMPIVRSNSL